MKRLIGLIFILGSSFVSNASHANLIDVEVVDRDSGREMPVFYHHGKSYVAGEPGHRYSVSLKNRSGERVLAVLSVDGVNAVTGETAEVTQSGYVLSPYESTEISGWRKNLNEVAQFVFSAPGKSYAARTGRPQNVGVIGVAVYREAAPIRQHRHERSYSDTSSASPPTYGSQAEGANSEAEATASAPTPSPVDRFSLSEIERPATNAMKSRRDQYSGEKKTQASKLGTAHGDREWSRVSTTEFRRASSVPDEIIELQYDTYAHLAERGVVPYREHHYNREPRAFSQRFVPDPY